MLKIYSFPDPVLICLLRQIFNITNVLAGMSKTQNQTLYSYRGSHMRRPCMKLMAEVEMVEKISSGKSILTCDMLRNVSWFVSPANGEHPVSMTYASTPTLLFKRFKLQLNKFNLRANLLKTLQEWTLQIWYHLNSTYLIPPHLEQAPLLLIFQNEKSL